MDKEGLVLVTMGDPTGVGGEMTLRAWSRAVTLGEKYVVLDDCERLQRLAKNLGIEVNLIGVKDYDEAEQAFWEGVPVLPLSEKVSLLPGDNPENSVATAMTTESIERSFKDVKQGKGRALLTNPIDKGVMVRSVGFSFIGHTDYLGYLDGSKETFMLFHGGYEPNILRTVPITLHVPLIKVFDLLSPALIKRAVRTLDDYLKKWFGIGSPRLWISGLNPHAGEGGILGKEDQEIIKPAIDQLKQEGVDCYGPIAGDTMFIEKNRNLYDACLCMTHDQALIGVKSLYFSSSVNLTLGLSVIRVSPGHGVARELSGKRELDCGSWNRSLALATSLSKNRGDILVDQP